VEKTTPDIALVVCTRNRAAKLGAFFDAIRTIKALNSWELIIVDNGSTDSTAEDLQSFAANFSGRVSVMTEPQIGVGRAKNRGWRASTAPIIAFTDDDCYPTQSFLNDIETAFSDQSLGVVGGRILLYDSTDARVTINESLTEQFLQAREFVYVGFIQGANMAFRRQALIEIDGFDNSFGPGTPFICEDADAVLRVLAAGWKGKYDPRPVVYHHHRRKPGVEVESLLRSYCEGRGACYMKCLLYMPMRWRCADQWLRATVRRQSLGQTLREFRGAIHYLFYQLKQRPNVKCNSR
jgi:glycosyltransferase involved in cell wall biosynthesis